MIKQAKNYFRENAPGFVLWTHKIRGIIAYYLYKMAPKKLKIIGITGTNGKTTTCHLTAKILEESGARVGMASTTNFKIGAKEWKNLTRMTTMSPFALQRLLKQMVSAGCEYAVIETTSHAIAQYRNWGIRYMAVALTNVTHEHLDYHKNMADYVKTKTRLFQNKPKVAVANLDDPSYEHFMHFTAQRHISYSLKRKADVVARKILPSSDGTIFTLVTDKFQQTISLKLPAQFNVSNALCAAAVCYGLNIPQAAIKKGLETVENIPGRLEKINMGQDFTVMIDYALTPDSLEKLYSTLKSGVRGKMIALIGSCGERDTTKRPIMGSIAGRYCDYVIVADEEPYSEDPWQIIEEVAAGVPRGKKEKMRLDENFFKILDRREGIRKALSLAQKGDLVIITGMGAQEYRMVKGKKEPWKEAEVVKEELKKLGYNKK